jgi:hypothetical protein
MFMKKINPETFMDEMENEIETEIEIDQYLYQQRPRRPRRRYDPTFQRPILPFFPFFPHRRFPRDHRMY